MGEMGIKNQTGTECEGDRSRLGSPPPPQVVKGSTGRASVGLFSFPVVFGLGGVFFSFWTMGAKGYGDELEHISKVQQCGGWKVLVGAAFFPFFPPPS